MKKISIFVLLCFLLVACVPNTNSNSYSVSKPVSSSVQSEVKEPTTSVTQSKVEEPVASSNPITYLKGYSLEYFGLKFEISQATVNPVSPTEQKQLDKDGSKAELPSYRFIENGYNSWLSNINGSVDMRIGATMKNMNPQAYDVDGIEVLAFQCFRAEDFTKDSEAWLRGIILSHEEVEKLVFYRNDEFVLCDFTAYMNMEDKTPISFEDHANSRWPDGNPDLDWAKELRDYYLHNIEDVLVKTDTTSK